MQRRTFVGALFAAGACRARAPNSSKRRPRSCIPYRGKHQDLIMGAKAINYAGKLEQNLPQDKRYEGRS
jgi:hypothetical protein